MSGSTGTWAASCQTNSLGLSAVGYTPVTGWVFTPDGSEEWLQNVVANEGLVSVGIVVVKSFYYYSSGIYYDGDCNASSANYMGHHAIVVVGYGTDPALGGDYWIVRNSWSEGWGMQGYVLMARNRGNHCGLASFASYPTV